jgi:hypothetical protein
VPFITHTQTFYVFITTYSKKRSVSLAKQPPLPTPSTLVTIHPSIKLKPYCIPQATLVKVREEIDKMEAGGIIEPTVSPWCAPVVPVTKKDGKLRLCVDYRKLNAITRKDRYPIPLIDEILDALGGATVYSTLNAGSGYWQVPLASEEDKDKTAFAIPGGGFYRFKVMPFGLSNASSTYQQMMEAVFAGILWM